MGLDPTTIGRYVVLGTLGQGAMGTVYLGEDPVLKRGVALKVVHGGHPQGREQALRRFRREAEISARLNHPNVITVFDVGDAEGVGPFLAMEFIDGETLDQQLKRGHLAAVKAMEVLLQAGSALDAAHAMGIVHRDVKPANLMVAKDGRVKLMDFGIAKEEEQTNTTEALLCTPGYAAPELLDGAKASPATDRWAFAVTAYECLRGCPPFDGENISVVLYNVAHGEPAFPADLDPALAAVFRKALAKHPADRHPDLHGLLAELLEALPLEPGPRRRFQDHLREEHEARPLPRPRAADAVPAPTPPAARRPDPRRVRILARAAAGVAAAGLLFLGWWNGILFPRRLRIESEPSGAWVFVEGKPAARTPVAALAVPRHADGIRLELDGYFPFPLELAGDDRAFRLRLTPRHLYLDFDSKPSGAQVFLNGRLLGTTPLRQVKVPNDLHGASLLVKRGGFRTWARTLTEREPPPPVIQLEPLAGRN